MPDLLTPRDAAEAAVLSECWDAVLSYADLCTAGSTAANDLAREAFALGIREARAADEATQHGAGRRASRLPRIPQLLTAVRATAAVWESRGQGHRLDPDLRLWLHSDKAARYAGPPLRRPVALRGLRDMQEADATLLWLAEVEALPPRAVARRQGLDPYAATEQLNQVRGLFRDRCHRAHLDTPMGQECSSYVRLLDAVTRSPVAETPEDLSRHLATCVECAEAAACLRLHGGGLPAALAQGVIGWGGLAYLERRRRAAEVRMGAGPLPEPTEPPGDPATGRARTVRNSLVLAAVLVSGLALAASLVPGDGDSAARGDRPADSAPVAGPDVEAPPSAAPRPSPSAPSPASSARPVSASESPLAEPSADRKPTGGERAEPEPQGTPSATAPGGSGGESGAYCTAAYRLDNQWQDGFQATVTVVPTEALTSWQVAWTYSDGQRVGQMWDASAAQSGPAVTASAADYNRSVPADGSLSFGFLGTWQGQNTAPRALTLNGHTCAVS
ncbi:MULTISPECIES: cellulose binding domain-containing protein [unclassified Streptomyces]|uniref:cellulose binding domain-containing protein n=1 Tax=unclassified Streptomyces TaxID=2593676 RepID=UPI0037F65E25